MNDIKNVAERNKENAIRLLGDAMPNQNYELMAELMTADATIERAGFADIYGATNGDIPPKGNFREWLKAGWEKLSSALTDQTSVVTDIFASESGVMMKFHMTALHTGTFSGAPATGKRVEWDEISLLHFNEEGKITDAWFMCQELNLARQIGYEVALKESK